MGDIRFNLRSALTIGGFGFLGVWLINRGLQYAGMGQWKA